MKINCKNKSLFFMLIIVVFFTGCGTVDDFKVKVGITNTNFDYMNDGNVKKITIENTRDKSYTFIVKDEASISEIYDILSNAKVVEEKISLDPDYIFRIEDKNETIKEFYYVAGVDKTDSANFYNSNESYIVSKRLDNDIIKYFWNIRRPSDFNTVYYENILKSIDKYKNSIEDKKVGINILDDREVMKFILTLDIEEFKNKLPKNMEILDKEKNDSYDVIMNITTTGYTSKIFKCIVEFVDKKNNTTYKYYIVNNYAEGEWDYAFTENLPPSGF
ncbi:hypothetical protein [Clostridium grantii]|uniref:YhfM-like domain-containing protein n=1 Tax=Clostridium grantii DSM 8605 TaxID=1121316 RepID=A0A1M5XUE7_9CLOT|nr:hypothetical protein [Clostridium grantii]SHI03376.1 hypothetical protein SAMN02745207_03942 [Clostridium grantii DSM 8605]